VSSAATPLVVRTSSTDGSAADWEWAAARCKDGIVCHEKSLDNRRDRAADRAPEEEWAACRSASMAVENVIADELNGRSGLSTGACSPLGVK
jgi:hypothetical protein